MIGNYSPPLPPICRHATTHYNILIDTRTCLHCGQWEDRHAPGTWREPPDWTHEYDVARFRAGSVITVRAPKRWSV